MTLLFNCLKLLLKHTCVLPVCILIISSSVAFAQDSLLYHNGKKITSVNDWETKRKPELKNLALENIYGFMPPLPKWKAEVTREEVLQQPNIIYKEVAIQLFKDSMPSREIHLSLFIPAAHQSKPVPVILALNKCGNITVSGIAQVSLFDDRTLHAFCLKEKYKRDGTDESLRGLQKDFWALDTLLKRGYALATFHEADIAADLNTFQQGIFPFYPELKNDTGWGVIAAWAWGMQCAVDYLVTDKHIDAQKIILYGHSRRGKAALLAAALDERVAMAVPHQSGTGGMALSKKHPLESVKRINKSFPFWFNQRFKTFAKHPKSLPLDQHYLLALMAPRPVLETVGKWDVWSSYWLSLKTLRLVSPVYDLYQAEGLKGKGKLSKRKNLTSENTGNLLQVRRPYKHTMNADYWNFILDFADMKLKSKL